MKKPTLNKWEWTFEHGRPYAYLDMAWRTVRFGVYKFTRLPDAGETYSKKDYKGFIISFDYWFPIRFN